jgi:hypothetical protein
MLGEMSNDYTPIGSIIVTTIRLDKNRQISLQKIYMKQQNKFSDLKAQPIDILNAMMTHSTLIIPVKKQTKNFGDWFGKGRSAIAYDKANNEYVSLLLKNQTTFERFYKKSNQIKKKKFSKNVLENQFLWVFDPEQQPPTEDLRSSFYSITEFSDGNEDTFDNIIERSNDNKLKQQSETEEKILGKENENKDEGDVNEGIKGGAFIKDKIKRIKKKRESKRDSIKKKKEKICQKNIKVFQLFKEIKILDPFIILILMNMLKILWILVMNIWKLIVKKLLTNFIMGDFTVKIIMLKILDFISPYY